MMKSIQRYMVVSFSTVFLSMSIIMLVYALYEIIVGLHIIIDHAFFTLREEVAKPNEDDPVITTVLNSVSSGAIALALYELGMGISSEYFLSTSKSHIPHQFYRSQRKAVTRFVAVAVIALVLESFILVIKFANLNLVGNLTYPIGLIVASGFLLISLGIFLYLTQQNLNSESKNK